MRTTVLLLLVAAAWQAAIANPARSWQAISPAGETRCSDGSEYRFLVRKGKPEHLVLYFQGGGACWSRETCDLAMSTSYSPRVGGLEQAQFGIFNQNNPNNPFKNHTIVFAPYCTGDVHLGASDTVYQPITPEQEPLTIFHRGRTNAQAVLDWTYANVTAPESILVTGSSAGAIPSPLYASIVANHYQEARVAQLGDGAGGYRRSSGDNRPQDQWGSFNFLNEEQGFEHITPDSMTYEALYVAAAKAHPDIMFTQYDAAEDSVQKYFLNLGGSPDADLIDNLKANHADIRGEVINFRSLIVGGESHTILGRPEFYAWAAQDVSVRDWVADVAAGRSVDNVSCQDCASESFAGPALPAAAQRVIDNWNDPKAQYVSPFKIFDNAYYVGIDWVSAYLIDTGEGLVLIDSLYGPFVPLLIKNIQALGFNPADIKYVINTHGHFDHAGGAAIFQKIFGATVVMTEEDWTIARAAPETGQFYIPTPRPDRVAEDGEVIKLGDNRFELFKTPGHTEGVLSIKYTVRDGDETYEAMTLGGVGLNFSGADRTKRYIQSYQRLQSMQQDIQVSLPNHAEMGSVFERRDLLATRNSGAPHPFVDPKGYAENLARFLVAAEEKLALEESGNAPDPFAALLEATDDEL